MSREQKQRDILFDAIKRIATNKRTPEWISGALTQAVMAAKQVTDDVDLNSVSLDEHVIHNNNPVAVGKLAQMDTLDNTHYVIKILTQSEEVEGITLWHVQIVQGKGPHAVGSIVYNVPETWIHDVEA